MWSIDRCVQHLMIPIFELHNIDLVALIQCATVNTNMEELSNFGLTDIPSQFMVTIRVYRLFRYYSCQHNTMHLTCTSRM